ncbi:hypothetical protein K2173_018017 [Erythroxylum novogranatense]|uniref:Carboxypeptidase n=1 Tax=Erythroxylum novogranatense TaxID=1862640 RepID=A0AAV8TUA4_9ROSI|nr:hypothetical protein K2173_018017 [Erythroxylum novogranatense]
MRFPSSLLIVVICTTFVQICMCSEANRIQSLPGQPQVGFQQHAGYITVDEYQQRALFYYLVETETEPASKPLLLWFNGGPGCSSVGVGAFQEHGPFRPSNGGSLIRNHYSWNNEANVLYVESPAGVGFSYSANTSFYKNVNDTITAQDNLMFLHNWFVEYPQYKGRDFYISGESYAGHYVPQLAQLILLSGSNFNLKGIAIGNPLVEFERDINSQALFLWSHGLISDDTYKLTEATCNMSQMWREDILFYPNITATCTRIENLIGNETSNDYDNYDVLVDICLSNGDSQVLARNQPLKVNSRRLSSLQSSQENPQPASQNIDPCVGIKTYEYLNRKEVQEALHAKLNGVGNWTTCTSVASYDFTNLFIPTIHVVGYLVRSGIRVLVYSGDQDSVIPFMATRSDVHDLAKAMGLNTTSPYRAWYMDKQVAGWTQVYNNILTYATIRGGSHMAPWSSPGRSLALIKAFLAGKPLPEA